MTWPSAFRTSWAVSGTGTAGDRGFALTTYRRAFPLLRPISDALDGSACMGHKPSLEADALQGAPVFVVAPHLGLAFIAAPMTVPTVQR